MHVEEFDAIVIGAGISGLYQLHLLRQLGLSVRCYDDAGGVGGTWYWNRYPGARFDSESESYGYSWSTELWQEWEWQEHFSAQPENERYFNFVADRFDLRRDIRLDSRVTSARYDEAANRWEVELADGGRAQAQFLVAAVGMLSAPFTPAYEGLDDFAGESYHTARWPVAGVDFTGKRVAVIGTGASGVQIVPAIAQQVESLTVFQRTPNYCLPMRNSPVSDAEFVRGKIRERVHDPVTAEKLVPKDHPFGSKRLPLETDYYKTFNRDNVELVDLRDTPIERVTPTGIETTDAEYEFDVIVYATGFDAVTGALTRIDIRGVGGRSLTDANSAPAYRAKCAEVAANG
ncbi:NAD(P)/FAD-dependent oxidoreductase [Saccharothrix sp. CCNWLW140]|uniref:flavin-containing monooxygenase n=1 Tax=Saccharothrix sp. CCNWLW140 TaxID=3128895 RepID=UPI00307E4234